MMWGVAYIKVEQWSIPLLIQGIQKHRSNVRAVYAGAKYGGCGCPGGGGGWGRF